MHHEELSHIKLSCVEFETGLTFKANMPKLLEVSLINCNGTVGESVTATP